jgi:hypothetical protein
MNFEGSRSIVWVMESLTAVPLGSSSIVQASHYAKYCIRMRDLA